MIEKSFKIYGKFVLLDPFEDFYFNLSHLDCPKTGSP